MKISLGVIIIFPLIILFLNTSPPLVSGLQENSIAVTDIYLVKNNWHTGIVFRMEDVFPDIPMLKDFTDYRYVDIGWGEADFYQAPDFDAGLAVKALFYPTESTIRIEGFNFSIEKYVEISDMAVRISTDHSVLQSLISYISDTFITDENDLPVLLSSRPSGHIKYYEAKGNYHLFNTCNTWIAKGLNYSGIEIKDQIILAEQLFREAAKKGELLKDQVME